MLHVYILTSNNVPFSHPNLHHLCLLSLCTFQQVKGKKRSSVPFKPHKGKLPSFSGVDLTPLTDDSVLHKADRQQEESSREYTDTNGLAMLSSSTSIVKVQYLP